MPDPDLLIRTAGEMRVSNFLLWQISYAEIWVTPRCWPDFDRATLHQALRDYAGRERRFGGPRRDASVAGPVHDDSCGRASSSGPSWPAAGRLHA